MGPFNSKNFITLFAYPLLFFITTGLITALYNYIFIEPNKFKERLSAVETNYNFMDKSISKLEQDTTDNIKSIKDDIKIIKQSNEKILFELIREKNN